MSIKNIVDAELVKEIEELRKENVSVHNAAIKKQKELMKIRMSLVTELCPSCEGEQTIAWNTSEKGFKAFCPECGNRLMLCSECLLDKDFCDYDSGEDICYRVIEEMWRELEDVPLELDEEGNEFFKEEFTLCGHTFQAGMKKSELWAWFDKRHRLGISYLVNELM